jgi:hypothetical protein
VVADQKSTDGTLARLSSTSGVDLVVNESTVYNESYRQRLLLKRARQIEGKRILLALDADEALSANCIGSKEWEQVSEAQPGTVLRFRWVNVLPGFDRAWIPPNLIACGFVDDGSEHDGKQIHSRRVPWPVGAPVIDLKEVVVVHFQYVAWERVLSKQRWYQAWEHLNNPSKSALQIFRQYHHMHGSWTQEEIQPMRAEWLDNYGREGIDFRALASEAATWWDRELHQMLHEHGPERFRKIAIWEKDWNAFSESLGTRRVDMSDPRSFGERIAHRLLKATQRHRANLAVRGFERLLRNLGW